MAIETDTVMVPMEVKYEPAWLTWVSATTACLRALGVKCDLIDVAGTSGYAFHICVVRGMCPSGPTQLDWERLNWGVRGLGRGTHTFYTGQCHTDKSISDLTKSHCRAAFEFARREIGEGRPCVLWGAYTPDCAVVVGVQGDSYIVRSYREALKLEQPPVRFDELDAPGGIYVLAFPTTTDLGQARPDEMAVYNAVSVLSRPADARRTYGAAAYRAWVEELQGKQALKWGNAYNAVCYAEGRRFAGDFVARVAKRNAFAAEPLGQASEHYGRAAEAMKRLAELFPFHGPEEGTVTDEQEIAQGVDALRMAEEHETKAGALLAEVARMDWPSGA
jgi:hypothetical protein